MILISNIILEVLDGSTIASTEIYGVDKKTYINIGSGNVFKLRWNTPVLTNDFVDHYDLVVKRHDPTLGVYYDIFNKNIGLTNEFFVDSALLPSAPDQYKLSIYLEAYGRYGNVITSNTVGPYVSKGGGSYVKVGRDRNAVFEQPIMKRALGFVNLPRVMSSMISTDAQLVEIDDILLADINGKLLSCSSTVTMTTEVGLVDLNDKTLTDAEQKALYAVTNVSTNAITELADINNKILTDVEQRTLYTTDNTTATPVGAIIKLADIDGNLLTNIDDEILYISVAAKLLNSNGDQYIDAAGRALFAPVTRLLSSASGWTVVQNGYVKDQTNTWRANDIKYEMLQVRNVSGKYEVLRDSTDQPIYIL